MRIYPIRTRELGHTDHHLQRCDETFFTLGRASWCLILPSVPSVTEEEITEKIKMTEIFRPSRIIFCSYEGWDESVKKRFEKRENVEFLDLKNHKNANGKACG